MIHPKSRSSVASSGNLSSYREMCLELQDLLRFRLSECHIGELARIAEAVFQSGPEVQDRHFIEALARECAPHVHSFPATDFISALCSLAKVQPTNASCTLALSAAEVWTPRLGRLSSKNLVAIGWA